MTPGCSAAADVDGHVSGTCTETDELQSARIVRTEKNWPPIGETESLLQRPDVFYSGSVVDVHVDADVMHAFSLYCKIQLYVSLNSTPVMLWLKFCSFRVNSSVREVIADVFI